MIIKGKQFLKNTYYLIVEYVRILIYLHFNFKIQLF